jgi:hypothetical protein
MALSIPASDLHLPYRMLQHIDNLRRWLHNDAARDKNGGMRYEQ